MAGVVIVNIYMNNCVYNTSHIFIYIIEMSQLECIIPICYFYNNQLNASQPFVTTCTCRTTLMLTWHFTLPVTIIEIRWSWGPLNLITGIHIVAGRHLYIETAPMSLVSPAKRSLSHHLSKCRMVQTVMLYNAWENIKKNIKHKKPLQLNQIHGAVAISYVELNISSVWHSNYWYLIHKIY